MRKKKIDIKECKVAGPPSGPPQRTSVDTENKVENKDAH